MRVLYITRSPPRPLTIGGNQRTHFLYRALSRLADVDLFLAVDPETLGDSQLREIKAEFSLASCVAPQARGEQKPWRALKKIAPSLGNRLADIFGDMRRDYLPDARLVAALELHLRQGRYDAAVVKSLSLARKSGLPPDFPVILDVDDVEFEWLGSQMRSPASSWLRKAVATHRLRAIADFLPTYYRQYALKWVTKRSDLKFPGFENARVLGVPVYLPNGKLPVVATASGKNTTILMIGSYYHRPNVEGLAWFVRRVWPSIRVLRPMAQFRVVGPGLPASWARKLEAAGGCYVGVVADLASEFNAAAFTIAPIWSGAGINVKVFESYIYGRPCVATTFASRGCEECLVEPGALRVAADAGQFAQECVHLLCAVQERQRMVKVGLPRVLDTFSFERFARVVAETLQAVEHRSGRLAQAENENR